MNYRTKPEYLTTALAPRQQKLEFTRPLHWQQLPSTSQQACRQALAKLLSQVISQAPQEDDDERDDPAPPS
jgi:hypothetical protein